MRTSQLLLRGALFAAMLPFTTAASCDSGDRAETGACPSGETCSAETPNGLHFRGAVIAEGFFDEGDVKVTAVGGTQDVNLVEVDANGLTQAFTLGHDVETSNSHVRIEGSIADSFVLRGKSSGDSYVRVVDPETGELFDRLSVSAQPIESVQTLMTLSMALASSSDTSTPNKLYAPGAAGYIRLAGEHDRTLVDTSATIAGDGVTQTAWDEFVVGDLAPGPHTLSVNAGGVTKSVPFEVAIPDTVTTNDTILHRGVPTFTCFVARRGSTPVHAQFGDFTSTQATFTPTDFHGCVQVKPSVVGTVVIHVTAGGVDIDLAMTSEEPSSHVEPTNDTAPYATGGERASSLAAE